VSREATSDQTGCRTRMPRYNFAESLFGPGFGVSAYEVAVIVHGFLLSAI
jgi:hypothetical protein